MFNGERIGTYVVMQVIGRGGMGEVALAQNPQGYPVAIKRMHPNIIMNQDAVRRFQREQEVLYRLRHPNIVSILDMGVHQGLPYFVMAYIEGQSLTDYLRSRALNTELIERVVSDIGDALSFAHSQGILHRDIKPSNILIANFQRAYLSDFGIATAPRPNENLTQTMQHAGLGTQNYMAPEVLHGNQAATVASEVFSFGASIYEMLTRRIFTHDYYNGILDRYLAPNILPIIAKSTATHAMQRYPDISSFQRAFINEWRSIKATETIPAMPIVHIQTTPPYPGTTPVNSPVPVPVPPPQNSKTSAFVPILLGIIILALAIFTIISLVVLLDVPTEEQSGVDTSFDPAPISVQVQVIPNLTITPTVTFTPIVTPSSVVYLSPAYSVGQTVYLHQRGELYLSVFDQSSGFFLDTGTAVTILQHPVDNTHYYFYENQYYYYGSTASQAGWIRATVLSNNAPALPQIVLTPYLEDWFSQTLVLPRQSRGGLYDAAGGNLIGYSSNALFVVGYYAYIDGEWWWTAQSSDGTLSVWLKQSEWYTQEISSRPVVASWQQGQILISLRATNLREQPYLNAPVIMNISANTRFSASGYYFFDETGRQWWWHVQLDSSRSGWLPQSELGIP